MTRMHTGFTGVVHEPPWPRPHAWGRPIRLEFDVKTLAGVGPSLAKRLRTLGIGPVGDVLFHRPRRYESAADEVAIAQLWGDEEVALAGVVENVRLRRPRRGLTILSARVRDSSGSISATWFNQPWLAEQLQPGTH